MAESASPRSGIKYSFGRARSAAARPPCGCWRLRRSPGGWKNTVPQSDVSATRAGNRKDPARNRRLSGGHGNFRRNSPTSSLKRLAAQNGILSGGCEQGARLLTGCDRKRGALAMPHFCRRLISMAPFVERPARPPVFGASVMQVS